LLRHPAQIQARHLNQTNGKVDGMPTIETIVNTLMMLFCSTLMRPRVASSSSRTLLTMCASYR
jgi:hypothetical protein